MLDTGIYQRILQLDLSRIITRSPERLVNEGAFAEVYAGSELISGMPNHIRPELFYWHREAPASNAEIDYLFSHRGQVVPIEVKSGTRGSMKSMHMFLMKRPELRGTRLSHENFGSIGLIDIVPLYAACWLPTM